MRELLEELSAGHKFYYTRTETYASDHNLPFEVTPEPFSIDKTQAADITRIGEDISAYMAATAELYAHNDEVKELLDRGKPEIFKSGRDPEYLFYRPDLMITERGLKLCEIETSVFGLGLAELLNRGYREAGWDTIAGTDTLSSFVSSNTPSNGSIVLSQKAAAFKGQLHYLAETVFSSPGRQWQVVHAADTTDSQNIYRAYGLSEYLSDPDIRQLHDTFESAGTMLPTPTPQFEEKALLAFIWDKRFEQFYRESLGDSAYDFIQTIVPPTWIVGDERHFSPGMPYGIDSSAGLASLSRKQRTFVLKVSGFSENSRWAKGVHFLDSKSQVETARLLEDTERNSITTLHIVQEFHEGIKIPILYETRSGTEQINARVRITPYFAAKTGQLLTMKATGCENTHRVHASSSSINTAVLVK